MMKKNKKVALVILDGWGIGDKSKSDAIFNAKTPFMDGLLKNHPHAQLLTSGEHVGLPEGQMGNSEVGHLNIGAGRVVYQDLAKINLAVKSGDLSKNPELLRAFEYAKNEGKKLHFMGLVSNGGVHSSNLHLHHLCELAEGFGLKKWFIHAFTDGRDCDPKSGLGFIKELNKVLENKHGELATVTGRYYAMDRDKRWERVKIAWDALVNSKGELFSSAEEGIVNSYNNGITDEFIKPIVIHSNRDTINGNISAGDVVICFNFRTDRCREITTALTQQDFPKEEMQKLELYYVTMTNYDKTFQNVHVLFEKDNLVNTLGEVLSSNGKTQLRIAETEKYPHVTFFFSGGREQPFKGEHRIMVNSPKVATYDLQPEMSALKVCKEVCEDMENRQPDFICLNFANPDMVGHTGVYPAIIKAVETIDGCTSKVINTGLIQGYSFVIIADHGNADLVINPDGTPNTAHSTNPVPCIIIDPDNRKLQNGILADIAPTILDLLGVPQPDLMTGKTLLSN